MGPAAVQRALDMGEVVLVYDETGEGPPVVYAHGLTSSRANDPAWLLNDWSPLVAAGRRLIRYDARGHGASTGRAEQADYTWSRLAGDLLAVLDRVAGADPVDVMGTSMGCGTLIHAALARPERFRRLVLVAPPTAWETRVEMARVNRLSADLVERHGLARLLANAAHEPQRPPFLARARGEQRPPAISERLYPHVMRGAAGSDLPDPEQLCRLTQPALILAWPDDPGHPLSTAQRLAELMPDARLRVSRDERDVRDWGEHAAAFLTG